MQITILGLGKSTISAIHHLQELQVWLDAALPAHSDSSLTTSQLRTPHSPRALPEAKPAIPGLSRSQHSIQVLESKNRDNYDTKLISSLEQSGVVFQFGYQEAAINKLISGSDLILTSPGVPPKSILMQTVMASGIQLITDLDLFIEDSHLRGNDGDTRANYMMITGTNGKTTTTALCGHILESEPVGNIGKPFMDYRLEPGPNPYNSFALEVSSFQIFYSELKFQRTPKALVHLNLTPDHLDWHADHEEYKATKEKLFYKALDINPEIAVVLNYDNEATKAFGEQLEKRYGAAWAINYLRYFSTEEDLSKLKYSHTAYLKDKKIILNGPANNILSINTDNIQLVGKHNYSNILAAIQATHASNIPIEQIIKQCQSFKAVEHRLEYTCTIDGKKIYNDSKATNPDSAIKALDSFDRSIAIVGGKDKYLDLSEFIDVAIKQCSHIVAIGELKTKIQSMLEAKGYANIETADTLAKAFEIAISKPGHDPIVLAPASSSFDMFKSYEDRGHQFKEIALNYK